MKLVNFIEPSGTQSSGIIDSDDMIRDARHLVPAGADLVSLILDGATPALTSLLEAPPAYPRFSLDEVQLLPPIVNPGKIICVGLNYREHAEEGKAPQFEHPTVFVRFADTQVGHGGSLVIPVESASLDYEGELAIVIGRGGRRIPRAKAMSHILGYSCYNDASVREWQRHTRQWTPGKNFPATGAFGPFLVTPDEVDDITQQELTTTVNGEVRQRIGISSMIFDIAELVAYISTFTELGPGDVIVTGTPSGVGTFHVPPRYLEQGDVVEVSITGVGTLSNPVVRELELVGGSNS